MRLISLKYTRALIIGRNITILLWRAVLCCRRTGRPDGRHTRGRPSAGDQRRRPVRGAAVHGHSATAEHRRPGGDHRFATATTVVVHQRGYAVRVGRGRGRLGHRVGHLYPVSAQLARADARPDRVPAPVQECSEEGAGVRQRLFRRHSPSVLHTRARRLRYRQYIQNSREPGQGRAARFRPVPSTSAAVLVQHRRLLIIMLIVW